MKNLILIFILALTIFASSCKSHKTIVNEQTHTTVDSTVNLDIETLDVKSNDIQTNLTVTAVERIIDLTEETVTITEYSVPDTAGKQSVIKTTTIFRKKDIETNTGIDSNKNETEKTIDYSRTDDKSTTDFAATSETKTITKTKDKDRTWIALLIITGIIAAVVFLIWKYFPR